MGVSPLAGQPRIEHEDVNCLSPERFTELVASIQPPEQVRSAKLYFRSAFYPEFYFVEMTASPAGFQAVLPLPTKDTTRVVYYIEAVDVSFQTARSQDYEVTIESGCRPGPGGLFFPGSDPGIVIGATRAGAVALPAGFQATGVGGFITAAGGAAAAGGGIGTGLAIGAAAGAAAGVGVIVATGGEDSGTNGPGGSVPPGGVTTTANAEGGGTTSSTTTAPAGSGSTTTSPSGPGPSSTTTVPPAPTPPTTTAPVTLNACFRWEALGNCMVRFESCSTPTSEIQRYEWRMLGPPVPEPPASESFTFDFNADPRCRDQMEFNRPVRLTVYDAAGASDSTQENVRIVSGSTYRATVAQSARLRFETFLAAPAPGAAVRGQIQVDEGPLIPLVNGQHVPLEARPSRGSVTVTASLLTPAPAGSYWELDFTASDGVVPGSLRVEQGDVASASDRRVVLRLSGEPGEVIRLRLQIH